MNNQKLYICGITQNKYNQIKAIVDLCNKYVNGFVWTDHYSTDGTYELLEQNKEEGKIYQQEYSYDHDFSANRYLRSGHIKEGDWCFVLDSSDLPNEVFLKDLKENIKYWDKNGVGLIYGDRPWLFKYYSTVFFFGTPHWGTSGHIGKTVNLQSIPGWRKENYLFNGRDTLTSGFIHPIRYYWEFGRSNHLQLLYYQFSPEIYHHHEQIRINFRLYCKYQLGIDLTLDSLIKYLQENVGKYPKEFEEIMEYEVNLKDAFRLFVLKQPWQDVGKVRFDWSYFHWKNTGEIIQDSKQTKYTGVFNQYREQKGLPKE